MHEQAFHTCCRRGLTARPGFQYNAVSAGLSRAALEQLAADHAGYQVPRDTPPEPTPEQLELFPVSLRCRPVDGLGAVVSRTAYVGREFRSQDGEPNTGRFGNYFSHIVIGAGDCEPFDGLMAIELWEAEHWTTRESPDPVLAPVGPLAPGPLDVDGVLAVLLPDRAAWIPEVVGATMTALAGGPRVVLVEDPGPRAAAWVALVCFALPRAVANALTFSTFEGRPRYVDVHLTLTTAGCDVAFPAHELGHRVTVIDVHGGVPDPARQTLLGAAVAALARAGGEALANATRSVTAEDCADAASLGAAFAVIARCCELVRDDADVVASLRLIERWHQSERGVGDLALATRAVAACHAPATDAALGAWVNLHAAARAGGHAESADLVDAALEQLMPSLDRLGQFETVVSCEAPVRPSVARLAEFVDGLPAPPEPSKLGQRIAGGWQLGLVGINAEVDRRFAVTLAEHLDDQDVGRTFAAIRSHSRYRELLGTVIATLLERAVSDPAALRRLAALGDDEIIERALMETLRTSKSFETLLVGAQVQLRRHPRRRSEFAARLAGLADTDSQQAGIRRLFGPSGAAGPAEHAELLGAYAAAARRPPQRDIDAGWRALLAFPLTDPQLEATLTPLVETLLVVDPEAESHAAYVVWSVAGRRPPAAPRLTLEEWTRALAYVAARPPAELPDDRYAEFVATVARRILLHRGPTEHRACFEGAALAVGRRNWLHICGSQLALGSSEETAVLARLFEIWVMAPNSASRVLVLEELLPASTGRLTTKRREAIRDALPERLHGRWLTWSEAHPPSSAVARTVGRLRRKGEERG